LLGQQAKDTCGAVQAQQNFLRNFEVRCGLRTQRSMRTTILVFATSLIAITYQRYRIVRKLVLLLLTWFDCMDENNYLIYYVSNKKINAKRLF